MAESSSYQPYAKYFRDRYTAQLASTSTDGRTDLMQSPMRADAAGDSMPEEEIAANAAVIFRAGFETTTELVVNGLANLIAHPEQLALLREDPSLVLSAIEEVLRYEARCTACSGSPPAMSRSVARSSRADVHLAWVGPPGTAGLPRPSRDPDD